MRKFRRYSTLIGVLFVIAEGVLLILSARLRTDSCDNRAALVFSYLGGQPLNQWYICDWDDEPEELNRDFYDVAYSDRWVASISYAETNGISKLQIREVGSDEIEVAIPWEEEWFLPVNWVDEEQIAIHFAGLDGESRDVGIAIVNPWTGEQRRILPNLAGLQGKSAFTRDARGYLSYNFNGQYVVYVAGYRDLILYDIGEAREVWRITNVRAAESGVSWSPEGTLFAYMNPAADFEASYAFENYDEVFLVNQAGQERQLTHLAQGGAQPSTIRLPVWSPDGTIIVAWWASPVEDANDSPLFKLISIDVESGTVHEHNLVTSLAQLHPAVWNPDSQEVAVIAGPDEFNQDLYIVAMSTGGVLKVAEQVSGIQGWCKCVP